MNEPFKLFELDEANEYYEKRQRLLSALKEARNRIKRAVSSLNAKSTYYSPRVAFMGLVLEDEQFESEVNGHRQSVEVIVNFNRMVKQRLIDFLTPLDYVIGGYVVGSIQFDCAVAHNSDIDGIVYVGENLTETQIERFEAELTELIEQFGLRNEIIIVSLGSIRKLSQSQSEGQLSAGDKKKLLQFGLMHNTGTTLVKKTSEMLVLQNKFIRIIIMSDFLFNFVMEYISILADDIASDMSESSTLRKYRKRLSSREP